MSLYSKEIAFHRRNCRSRNLLGQGMSPIPQSICSFAALLVLDSISIDTNLHRMNLGLSIQGLAMDYEPWIPSKSPTDKPALVPIDLASRRYKLQ
jgi:hypothetical protein